MEVDGFQLTSLLSLHPKPDPSDEAGLKRGTRLTYHNNLLSAYL